MYQHLNDYTEFTGLRIASVLTVANLAGAAAGAGVAWVCGGLLAFIPGWLLWAVCIGLGLTLTWPYESVPLGQVLGLWLRFQIRRWLAPTTLVVDSGAYYPQQVLGPRVLLTAGLISYRGEHLFPGPSAGHPRQEGANA